MAAVLRVQNTAFGSGVQSANCSLAGVQASDLMAVMMRERDGGSIASLTVVSDLDGAFTQVVTRAASAARVIQFVRKNASPGTHVITVDFGGGTLEFDFNASAWGGCQTTGGADQSGSTGGGATTSQNHVASPITPSASALILTCWGTGADNGGETPGADGMTALNVHASASAGKQYYQYKVGQTAAIDGDFTTANSVGFDGCITAYLESAVAGGIVRQMLQYHG